MCPVHGVLWAGADRPCDMRLLGRKETGIVYMQCCGTGLSWPSVWWGVMVLESCGPLNPQGLCKFSGAWHSIVVRGMDVDAILTLASQADCGEDLRVWRASDWRQQQPAQDSVAVETGQQGRWSRRGGRLRKMSCSSWEIGY